MNPWNFLLPSSRPRKCIFIRSKICHTYSQCPFLAQRHYHHALMDDMYFQTLKAYYICIHKWLVSLRRCVLPATSAKWKHGGAAPSNYDLMIKNRPCPVLCMFCMNYQTSSQSSACRSSGVDGIFELRLKCQSSGSASYLFYFALISLFHSQLYLHFTSHHPQVSGFLLSHLLICHPWRAVGGSAFLKVLSWRYE